MFAEAVGLLDQQLVFNIQTPLRTPQVLTWLVQAFDPAGNLLGWGQADGFKVTPSWKIRVNSTGLVTHVAFLSGQQPATTPNS